MSSIYCVNALIYPQVMSMRHNRWSTLCRLLPNFSSTNGINLTLEKEVTGKQMASKHTWGVLQAELKSFQINRGGLGTLLCATEPSTVCYCFAFLQGKAERGLDESKEQQGGGQAKVSHAQLISAVFRLRKKGISICEHFAANSPIPTSNEKMKLIFKPKGSCARTTYICSWLLYNPFNKWIRCSFISYVDQILRVTLWWTYTFKDVRKWPAAVN